MTFKGSVYELPYSSVSYQILQSGRNLNKNQLRVRQLTFLQVEGLLNQPITKLVFLNLLQTVSLSDVLYYFITLIYFTLRWPCLLSSRDITGNVRDCKHVQLFNDNLGLKTNSFPVNPRQISNRRFKSE